MAVALFVGLAAPLDAHADPTFAQGIWAVDSLAHGASSFALDDEGRIWAWGSNRGGQFGDGTTNSTLNARRIPLPKGVTAWAQIAAGAGFAAVDSEGRLYGWGPPESVTSPPFSSQLAPVQLDAGPWLAVAVPKRRINSAAIPWGLGIRSDHTLAWLRVPPSVDPFLPAFSGFKAVGVEGISAGEAIVEIAAGAQYFLARTESGRVFAAGVGRPGVLGPAGDLASDKFEFQFVEVPPAATGRTWTRLAAAESQAFAWTDEEELYTWGRRYFSAAGIADWIVDSVPQQVFRPPDGGFWALAGGVGLDFPTTLLATTTGNLWIAGPEDPPWVGDMGHGFDLLRSRAILHKPASWGPVTAFGTGVGHLLVIGGGGVIHTTGANDDFQLGGRLSTDALPVTKSLIPGGDAPFLLGGPALLPEIGFELTDDLIVEPTKPDGSDAHAPAVKLVRNGRVDLDDIILLNIRARKADGTALPEEVSASLVTQLLQIANFSGGRIYNFLNPDNEGGPLQIKPRYALYTEGDLLFDIEVPPSLAYDAGPIPKVTLRYQFREPSNYPVAFRLLWPKEGALNFSPAAGEMFVELTDKDGYPVSVTARINGTFFGNALQTRNLDPVPVGSAQIVRFAADFRGPPLNEFAITLTATDDRGYRSSHATGTIQQVNKALPSLPLRIGGRETRVSVNWLYGPDVALEFTEDWQSWKTIGVHSTIGNQLPQDTIDLPDTGAAQRFYRLRPLQ